MQTTNENFYKWDGDILVLNVLGTPAAKKDTIGKIRANELKISVSAAPEGGKATEYMIKFLAKTFGVRKSEVELVFGQTSIHKQFRIKAPKKLIDSIEKAL
jgi:uncharacterized protein